jgi:hypothetical protein
MKEKRPPLCPVTIARNMATLLIAVLRPLGGPEIWSGIKISTSFTSNIPISPDTKGCPLKDQPYYRRTLILEKNYSRFGNTPYTAESKSWVAPPTGGLTFSMTEN